MLDDPGARRTSAGRRGRMGKRDAHGLNDNLVLHALSVRKTLHLDRIIVQGDAQAAASEQ